jgi:hypothetical protein
LCRRSSSALSASFAAAFWRERAVKLWTEFLSIHKPVGHQILVGGPLAVGLSDAVMNTRASFSRSPVLLGFEVGVEATFQVPPVE